MQRVFACVEELIFVVMIYFVSRFLEQQGGARKRVWILDHSAPEVETETEIQIETETETKTETETANRHKHNTHNHSLSDF